MASSKYLLPIFAFFISFGAYVSNGDFLPGTDQQGNMLLSVNLLKRHAFSLSPPDAPGAFLWRLQQPGEEPFSIAFNKAWNSELNDLYEKGQLQARGKYYVAQTTRPEVYVNTFGIGSAIVGLPVYAVLDLFVDIESDHYWWWHGSALTASLLTASAALFIFLVSRRFVAPLPAFLVALTFGLGSCAWPISSQALWQHPANTFFLSLSAYFLIGIPERKRYAAYCGAALGLAVWCRPTSAVVVVCVGVYLLWVNRRWFAAFVLGGLPFAAILAAYNGYYFGNPLEFGQTIASKKIALATTGSDDLWQSPVWESLPGLFISPSRGLAFFSPVLLFGLVGAVAAWKEPRYRVLIPLQVATALLILVASKWYDWWGGTTYGYRSIVDIAPFFALSMVPVIERILANHRMKILFGALLLWSITAQFAGAYSYSLTGWTEQWWNEKRDNNPDKDSLWQWAHPQIAYHIVNFKSERARKKRLMQVYTNQEMPILYSSLRHEEAPDSFEAHANLGFILIKLGRFEKAETHLRRAIALDPQGRDTHLKLGEALYNQRRYEEALKATRVAVEQAPDLSKAHANLGVVLKALGRYEEAIDALAQAAALDPASTQATELYFHMGQAAQKNGQPETAAGYYIHALELDPHHAQALHWLAMLRAKQQRFAEALELFQRLIDIDPSDAVAHGDMGLVLFHLGRSDEALQHLDQALSLDPTLENARANRAALLEAMEGNSE